MRDTMMRYGTIIAVVLLAFGAVINCTGNYENFWNFSEGSIQSDSVVYSPPTPPPVPMFFLCNEWVDKDQNGETNEDEWVGIKNQFRSHEKITSVARFHNKIGATVHQEFVNAGTGCRWDLGSCVVKFDEFSLRDYQIPASRLINRCGVGDYQFRVYLNDALVATVPFSVVQ